MPLIAGGADSCGMIRYSTTTAYLPMSGSQGFPPRDTGLGWRGAPMECAIGSNGKTSTSRNRGHSRFHVPSARGRAISTSGMHPKWDIPVLVLFGCVF